MLLDECERHGLERDHVQMIEVVDQADADRLRFIGSPTIRFDGEDLADTGDSPYAMDCRLFYRRDGRPSPVPDPEDLAESVAAYAAAHAPNGD